MTSLAALVQSGAMSDSPLKKRHPMIAFAGGVLAPGLGFWLTGRAAPALLTAALAVGAVLIVPLVVIDADLGVKHMPALLIAVSAGVRFGAAALAAFLAFRDAPRAFKPFEHPWWAVGFVLLTFFGNTTLRDRVASPRVAAFGYSLDTALAPTAEAGTMVVVQRRGFDATKARINDLIAMTPKSPSWSGELFGFARVIALPGSVVEINESGQVKVDGFPVITTPCAPTVPHNGRACLHEKQATPQGAVERYTTTTSFSREYAPTSVGQGQLFVLPDDRGRKLAAPAGLINVADVAGLAVIAR